MQEKWNHGKGNGMKLNRICKAVVLAAVCACALLVVAGCGGSQASSSASSSASNTASSSASASSSSSSSSAAVSSTASSSTTAGAAATKQAEIEKAKQEGYQVFEGTVHVVSAEDLVKLQGINIDPAMASNGGTYAVLAFDEQIQVTGESGDGSGQRVDTAKMLGLAEFTSYSSFVVQYGDLDMWRPLDGQRATVGAKASDIWFPSDVRLPMGEPNANTVILLS